MQRGNAADQGERAGRERPGEEVADYELHTASRALPYGQLDARRMLVDARDVPDPAGELPGEHPLAAAQVQCPLAARRDRRQDSRVVVDVVVPPPLLPAHASRCCHTGPRPAFADPEIIPPYTRTITPRYGTRGGSETKPASYRLCAVDSSVDSCSSHAQIILSSVVRRRREQRIVRSLIAEIPMAGTPRRDGCREQRAAGHGSGDGIGPVRRGGRCLIRGPWPQPRPPSGNRVLVCRVLGAELAGQRRLLVPPPERP